MELFNKGDKAYLLLADGTVYEGRSFGKKGTVVGEVVFTTGMVNYQETFTDPSHYGQIVLQTFPLVGNAGINDEDYDTSKSYISGYIVREWCNTPSNFRSQGDINDFLVNQNVIGIHSIDTRSLTKKIRECGVMNGVITTDDVYAKKDEFLGMISSHKENTIDEVCISKTAEYKSENSKYRVVLMDFGYKRGIKDSLLARGCDVVVMPYNSTAEQIKAQSPDGIVVSNGPGDPAQNKSAIENMKEIIALGIPVFGISMGHQIIALANGAKTHKLSYGHRGGNQPVVDLGTGRTYVTSQNHGYVVDTDSIDNSIAEVSHINANDKTCEGIRYKNAKVITVQFYPDMQGGANDTVYLFDEFIGLMEEK